MAQDIIVSLFALGALLAVGWRLYRAIRPAHNGEPACSTCPSPRQAGPQSRSAATVIPLNALRSTTGSRSRANS